LEILRNLGAGIVEATAPLYQDSIKTVTIIPRVLEMAELFARVSGFGRLLVDEDEGQMDKPPGSANRAKKQRELSTVFSKAQPCSRGNRSYPLARNIYRKLIREYSV
jgi:hypothetical protein